jgi:excisionase family DNA binding protein
MNDKTKMIDMRELVTLLSISRTTAYKLIKEGKLPAQRLSSRGKFYFDRTEVMALRYGP